MRASLMLSTAIATMAALGLAKVDSAQAANVKFKPQVKVNVQAPKVRPGVRIRVRAAKPKVRVRVAKPDDKTPSQRRNADRAVEAPVTAAKTDNDAPARSRAARRFQELPETIALLPTPSPRKLELQPSPAEAQLDMAADPAIERLDEALAAREAAEATLAAADIGAAGAAGDTGDFLDTPELGGETPSNQDRLDGMFKEGSDNTLADSDAARFGPDSFAGLPNTHGAGPANANGTSSADAAAGFWGVSQGRINAAIGGIASGGGNNDSFGEAQVTKGRAPNGDVLVHKQHRDEESEGIIREEVQYRDDGRVTYEMNARGDSGYQVQWGATYTDRSMRQRESGSGWGFMTTPDGFVVPLSGFDEKTDPDHVDPGAPSPFPWLAEEGRKTLRDLIGSAPVHVLTPDPHDQPVTGTDRTAPVVTQADLVERYDPDSTDRSSERQKLNDRPGPGPMGPGPNDT